MDKVELRGQRIAYRKTNPTRDDEKTFLFKPRQGSHSNRVVLTWFVGEQVTARARTKYDQLKDDIIEEMVETDEVKATKFIAIPALGAFAVDDHTSDSSVGGRAAALRFKAICEQLAKVNTDILFGTGAQDVQKALDTWELDEFSFTVRPFNPHPSKFGEQFDALMKADHIGKMSGRAVPAEGQSMRDSREGIIAETKGLSDAGYGQFATSGTTPSGFRAVLASPKFDMNKEKNKER